MNSMENAANILLNLFPNNNKDSNYLLHKKQSLLKLHLTFQHINKTNIVEYVNYLQQWTSSQLDYNNIIILVDKIRVLLFEYKQKKNNCDIECFLPLLIKFMQHQNQLIRSQSIRIVQQLLSIKEISLIKNVVNMLLENEQYYYGYEGCLIIFNQYFQQFREGNQFEQIIKHKNFYNSYQSKKIFTTLLVQIVNKQNDGEFLKILLNFVVEKLLNDQDQIIRVATIKINILLIQKLTKFSLLQKQVAYDNLKQFYLEKSVRTKYVLIQQTQTILKSLPPDGISNHFNYLQSLLTQEQSEITQIVVSKLKYIFSYLDRQQKQRILNRFLQLKKNDVIVEQKIAQCIIDLLTQNKQEKQLITYLNHFLENQKDSIKLTLIKTFFKHEKSSHLYNYFKNIYLNDLVQSKIWRIRFGCIQILDNIFTQFEINDQIIQVTKNIIFDKTSKIRIGGIMLVTKYLKIKQMILVKKLIPMVLNQYLNSNYLYRQTVVFFIKETLDMIYQNKELIIIYKNIIQKLCQDQIQNVSQLAKKQLKPIQLHFDN